jgi:hypothetical protein
MDDALYSSSGGTNTGQGRPGAELSLPSAAIAQRCLAEYERFKLSSRLLAEVLCIRKNPGLKRREHAVASIRRAGRNLIQQVNQLLSVPFGYLADLMSAGPYRPAPLVLAEASCFDGRGQGPRNGHAGGDTPGADSHCLR